MTAQFRRELELYQMSQSGVQITAVTRWLYQIGPLSVYPASGKWSTLDGKAGSLGRQTIADLLRRIGWEDPRLKAAHATHV